MINFQFLLPQFNIYLNPLKNENYKGINSSLMEKIKITNRKETEEYLKKLKLEYLVYEHEEAHTMDLLKEKV